MGYLRESDIQRRNAAYAATSRRCLFKTASESVDVRGVFISHSHVDSTLAEQLADFISSFDVPVYVDILDTELPGRSGMETARHLRNKIASHPKFIALFSENALSSRWIPWELGYADGLCRGKPIPSPDVALMPVLRSAWSLPGVEYTGLYPEVSSAGDTPCLELPGGKRGPRFDDWLRSTPIDRAADRLFD